jgi:glutathione S-transferase
MTAALWHIELSHYNEKARWALDYKGIPHRRRKPLPGFHRVASLAVTRGKHDRLPVLQLDGRPAVGDSTAIIAALERYQPEPPLYPTDPVQRARALELEDFFDEELGPHLRTYGWYHLTKDIDGAIDQMLANHPAWHRRLMHAGAPLVRHVIKMDYSATPANAERALARIRAAMDRVEAELQPSGYLVGDGFSVADLTAAALFTPMISPPERPYAPTDVPRELRELEAELNARPGGEWVHEMYARHRGSSCEVAG